MSHKFVMGLAVVLCATTAAGIVSTSARSADAAQPDAGLVASSNPAGQLRSFHARGGFDLDNPFFQDIGTNGRRCVTCHEPREAWSITPAGVEARFVESNGTDPIFSNNDGSNCEGATPHSPAEQREAYSLLITRGLIRVGLNLPPNAEFVIDEVLDPYNCSGATNDVSTYRRPLPTANVRFLSAVMWDGRESLPTSTIAQDLARQANDATLGHADSVRSLTPLEARQIVEFETELFSAQTIDDRAGNLHGLGARGGPIELAREPFFVGINDPVGLNPSGAAFDSKAFTLFDEWTALSRGGPRDPASEARRSIGRGQHLFNTRPITLSGIPGLNGQTFSNGVTLPASFSGTCTVCHDSPNAGNHSVKAPLNIGLTDPAVAPYLPTYTLRNLVTGEIVKTTDPGRALISGKWSDIGKFKGPILRGLAARAPYFHNGAAATLEEVVEFYERRFGIGLTPQDTADLVAFLRAL
jgi:cytochrome c peroxidase